jgi:hypothetical protein
MVGKQWCRMLAATAGLVTVLGVVLAQPASAADTGATNQGTSNHGMNLRDPHAAKPATGVGNLSYGGGRVSTSPKVYIVYWGSQWGSAGGNGLPTSDPSGEAPLQLSFFQHLYGSGDTWSTSTTQYCQGVATGTTQCGNSGTHVGHPGSNPVAGTWVDNASAAPAAPASSDIANEAIRAAAHFGDYTGSVQYIIDTPHGVVPVGFGTQYCAWHDSVAASGGTIAYTNMPYVSDAGSSCGANFVPTGSSGVNGTTEGVTIVGGHEYAETLSDQWPSTQTAWTDATGYENGDKCAWISSGQGASAIVNINGANYAVQSLWSNNFNNNAGGCVNYYVSATNEH